MSDEQSHFMEMAANLALPVPQAVSDRNHNLDSAEWRY